MQIDKKQNSGGFTLVELLIYMAFAFLVISYSMSMTNSATRSYVRGREISKVQSNGRYAMAILARDVMNTGFKSILSDASGVMRITQLPGTWTGSFVETSPSADSAASFLFSEGYPADTLEIFKAEMVRPDSVDAVVRVKYTLDANHVLWRISMEFDSTAAGSWKPLDTLALSTNIEAFQCRFTIDGINWFDDPSGNRNKISAIQLELLMRTDREITGAPEKSYALANITFTPPSGDEKYLRRRYEEIVEVVNNGILYE